MTAGDDSRRSWVVPGICIALCVLPLLFWMLQPDNPRIVGLYHDDGSYFELGKSLLERATYRDPHLPEPIQTAKYPPGIPILTSVAQLVTQDVSGAVTMVRCVNGFFLVLGLVAFWTILRREGLEVAAIPLVFAFGWSTAVADFARVCMSEMPFFGLTAVATALLLRRLSGADRPWRHAIELSALCLLICMTRTIGVVTVMAFFAFLLIRGRVATGVRFFLLSALWFLLLQWFLAAKTAPAEGYEDVTVYGLSYGRIFLDSLGWLGDTVWVNATQGALFTVHHVVPATRYLPLHGVDGPAILWIGACGVITLVILGARREMDIDGLRPWHLVIAGTVVVALCWPADVGRFVIPLVPFLLLMVVRGFELIAGRRAVLAAAIGLCVASVSESLPTRFSQSPAAMDIQGRTQDTVEILDLVGRLHGLGDEAVVASTIDTLLASHGDIRGVWGWTTTANRHIYQHPEDAWQFNLGWIRHGDWIRRELRAAQLLFLEKTDSPLLAGIHAAVESEFGTRNLARTGDERESLLRLLEEDAPAVREQFRRLGVTHAVLALAEGNQVFEVLLARMVRRLAAEGRATVDQGRSTQTMQVWQIRP